MGRKIPAAASETPVAPSQAPAAKSRPRSPSQPSTARPVLRSRRSVSLSRQSDSPPDAAHAESGPRFIDVVRASLSPEAGRKGTGRHSGRDQSKGKGKGKRSPSREERVPPVELVPRESIRPTSHIHTHVHTCIRTYVHITYVHYIQKYVRTYMHTYIHTYIHA